jgi:hypothetical protein
MDASFSLDCAAAAPPVVTTEPSAADPVTFAKSRRVNSAAIDVPQQCWPAPVRRDHARHTLDGIEFWRPGKAPPHFPDPEHMVRFN